MDGSFFSCSFLRSLFPSIVVSCLFAILGNARCLQEAKNHIMNAVVNFTPVDVL